MRHLAAYLLLVLGGNSTPSAEDVTNVIKSAGGEVDEAALTLLMSELEGQSVAELLAKGKESLKSVAAAGPSSKFILFFNSFL
jgi:large subunit ribosomal protein LP2